MLFSGYNCVSAPGGLFKWINGENKNKQKIIIWDKFQCKGNQSFEIQNYIQCNYFKKYRFSKMFRHQNGKVGKLNGIILGYFKIPSWWNAQTKKNLTGHSKTFGNKINRVITCFLKCWCQNKKKHLNKLGKQFYIHFFI